MSDDIEAVIREAALAAASGPLGRLRRSEEMDVAIAAAAVRLLREVMAAEIEAAFAVAEAADALLQGMKQRFGDAACTFGDEQQMLSARLAAYRRLKERA
jgi:hypothetical protein